MRYRPLLYILLLLLLVGCTVTKRKYMPGYSFQWNKSKIKDASTNSNGITSTSSYTPKEHLNTVVFSHFNKGIKTLDTVHKTLQTSNNIIWNKKVLGSKEIFSNISTINNWLLLFKPYLLRKDSAQYKQVSGGVTDKRRKYIPWAILFTILWVLGAFIVDLIIASYPFLSGGGTPPTGLLLYALIFLPFLILSLYYCNKAMQTGYNKGLTICILLDAILIVVLLLSVDK